MQKYIVNFDAHIPHEMRREINEKILYLINTHTAEESGITKGDIFNCYTGVSVGRFSPFRVGLKTPISVNLKSPMHHVCY